MTRGAAQRGGSAKGGRRKYPPLLLFLLGLALALALGFGNFSSRKGEVEELRAQLDGLQSELDSMRVRRASLEKLEERLKELEAFYRSVKWPPDPETQGVAWVVGLLEEAGWKVESLEISGGEPLPNGLKSVRTIARGKAKGAPSVTKALEKLLEARVSVDRIAVEALPEGALSMELQFAILTPQREERP